MRRTLRPGHAYLRYRRLGPMCTDVHCRTASSGGYLRIGTYTVQLQRIGTQYTYGIQVQCIGRPAQHTAYTVHVVLLVLLVLLVHTVHCMHVRTMCMCIPPHIQHS